MGQWEGLIWKGVDLKSNQSSKNLFFSITSCYYNLISAITMFKEKHLTKLLNFAKNMLMIIWCKCIKSWHLIERERTNISTKLELKTSLPKTIISISIRLILHRRDKEMHFTDWTKLEGIGEMHLTLDKIGKTYKYSST